MNKTKQSKVLYLDILRALACIIVVLFHCSGGYNEIGSTDFWICNINITLTQIGVPLFLMISGALMLDENYNFTIPKLRKHIIKMLMFFIFWSAFYCIRFFISGELTIWGISTDFIQGPYHLWFVPMLIGIYFIVPLLRLWVRTENKKWVEYYLILALLFASVFPNIIDHLTTVSSAFDVFNLHLNRLGMNYVLGYTGYFVLGWYLRTFDLKHKKTVTLLGVVGVVFTILGTGILSIIKDEEYSLNGNFRFGIIIYAIAVFISTKKFFQEKTYEDNRLYSAINTICNCSLGIYAIHAALVTVSGYVFHFNSAILQIPARFIFSISISLVLAWIIKKIPFLNKII